MLLCFCFILLTIQQVVLKLQKSVFYIIHQSGEQSIAGLWSLTHMLSAIHHLISCSFESSKSPIIIKFSPNLSNYHEVFRLPPWFSRILLHSLEERAKRGASSCSYPQFIALWIFGIIVVLLQFLFLKSTLCFEKYMHLCFSLWDPNTMTVFFF